MSDSKHDCCFSVINTRITAITLKEVVDTIHEWIKNRSREYLAVCNTCTVMECYDSSVLASKVNSAGLVVPDGMPLVWLGKMYGYNISRVYGPELMLALCEQGLEHGYRHFLYGSTPEVVKQLTARLSKMFPGIIFSGSYVPPFRELTESERQEVCTEINDSSSDIVWVGLGTPKQDHWVADFRDSLNTPVLIPVGAAFDFHAGLLSQAPRWMMRCGLEWFYRLIMEPRRLWKRYLIGNTRFLFHLFLQVSKIRKYPLP